MRTRPCRPFVALALASLVLSLVMPLMPSRVVLAQPDVLPQVHDIIPRAVLAGDSGVVLDVDVNGFLPGDGDKVFWLPVGWEPGGAVEPIELTPQPGGFYGWQVTLDDALAMQPGIVHLAVETADGEMSYPRPFFILEDEDALANMIDLDIGFGTNFASGIGVPPLSIGVIGSGSAAIATFGVNPTLFDAGSVFSSGLVSSYFMVHVAPGSELDLLQVSYNDPNRATSIAWFDTSVLPSGGWKPLTTDVLEFPDEGRIEFVLDANTQPTAEQLRGVIFTAGDPESQALIMNLTRTPSPAYLPDGGSVDVEFSFNIQHAGPFDGEVRWHLWNEEAGDFLLLGDPVPLSLPPAIGTIGPLSRILTFDEAGLYQVMVGIYQGGEVVHGVQMPVLVLPEGTDETYVQLVSNWPVPRNNVPFMAEFLYTSPHDVATIEIDWGDGSDPVVIDAPNPSGYPGRIADFQAEHTYATSGQKTITLTTTPDGETAVVQEFAIEVLGWVTESELGATYSLEGTVQASVSESVNLTVMIDPSNLAGVSFLAIDVDWGDGTEDVATLEFAPGGSEVPVIFAHLWAEIGEFPVTVTIYTAAFDWELYEWFIPDGSPAVLTPHQFTVHLAVAPPAIAGVSWDALPQVGAPLTVTVEIAHPDAFDAELDWTLFNSSGFTENRQQGVNAEGPPAGESTSFQQIFQFPAPGRYWVNLELIDDNAQPVISQVSFYVFPEDVTTAIALESVSSLVTVRAGGPALILVGYALEQGTAMLGVDWGDGSPLDEESVIAAPGLPGYVMFTLREHTYATPGQYTVTVNLEQNGEVLDETLLLTVHEPTFRTMRSVIPDQIELNASGAQLDVFVDGYQPTDSFYWIQNGVAILLTDVADQGNEHLIVNLPGNLLTQAGVGYIAVQAVGGEMSAGWPVFVIDPDFTSVDQVSVASGIDPFVGLGVGDSGSLVASATGEGTLLIATYDEDQTGVETPPTFGGALGSAVPTSFFDVNVAPGSTFTEVTVTYCDPDGGTYVVWYDPVEDAWLEAVEQSVDDIGCVVLVFNTTTSSPTIAELTGTVFAVALVFSEPPPPPPPPGPPSPPPPGPVGNGGVRLILPVNMVVVATGPDGAIVTFTATASNGATVNCTPTSGSRFPIGKTIVTCNGGGVFSTFTVTVTPWVDDDGDPGPDPGPDRGDRQPHPDAAAAFDNAWERTDAPVAKGDVSRTWIWGPKMFAGPLVEEYTEGTDGKRTVAYYDKARMELTDPDADPDSVWYVTTGLLVVELITGQMQVGHEDFIERSESNIPVAGDPDDPNGPTYATFAGLLDPVENRIGETITERLARDGAVNDDLDLAGRQVIYGYYDEVTGHNIAAPFWAFMNSSGLVVEDGVLAEGKLFKNPFHAVGRPITEAFWATVRVGGTPHDVLMQCFERRCLTYTPVNDPGWQVEAGNVGLHYYRWRYE